MTPPAEEPEGVNPCGTCGPKCGQPALGGPCDRAPGPHAEHSVGNTRPICAACVNLRTIGTRELSEEPEGVREARRVEVALGDYDREQARQRRVFGPVSPSVADRAVAALRSHADRLRAENARLAELLDVVDQTQIAIAAGELGDLKRANARLAAERDEARREAADLHQRVCDFQAASMLDVGGQGGPCLVEPRHVEEHVTRLRADLEAAKGEAERLRQVIACERGEWAPEGWRWDGGMWNHDATGAFVGRLACPSAWEACVGCRSIAEAPTALAAIEAADLALSALRASAGGVSETISRPRIDVV